MTRSQLLNLVLDRVSLHKKQTDFENESWIFTFKLRRNTSEYEIIVSLRNYFDSLPNITFRSRIYALVETEYVELFEVYRKMPVMNLTISLLCKVDVETNGVKFVDGNEIWSRRKDLSGVHFNITYRPDHSLISTVNNVMIKPCIFLKGVYVEKFNLKKLFVDYGYYINSNKVNSVL